MDIDRDAIVQIFLEESKENLSLMEESLVAVEAGQNDEETLRTIFRMAHTLKGNAASLGFPEMARFAHVVEDLLERLRDRRIAVSTGIVTLLLRAVDALRQIVPACAAGAETLEPPHAALLEQLAEAVRRERKQAPEAPHAPAAERRQTQQTDIVGASERVHSLRVETDKLDRMLNLIGEIAIANGQFGQMLQSLGASAAREALELHHETDHLYRELQEQVMRIRMVPVGPIFHQYARIVRDVARAHGKLARLILEGEEVEVDTSVVDHLRDPLTHMIRNALDHGIEFPDIRSAKGKEPCGSIILRAYHQAGNIVVQVSDDGGGFDRKRIVEQALTKGLILSTEKLTDQQILRLAFEPGLSTAESVTELSGRGIGMDVVLRNIEALRGSIAIDSREGEGTTLTIRLPLTLAIIDGFAVGVGQETYVLPLDDVRECLEMPEEERRRGLSQGVIPHRGTALPYVRLRHLFGLPEATPARENIVVVRHAGAPAGLVVDTLYGESQTVIKPLGKPFQSLPGVAGSAILGSGRIALILEVSDLLAEAAQFGPEFLSA